MTCRVHELLQGQLSKEEVQLALMTSPSRSKPLPLAPPTPRRELEGEKVEEAIESDNESRGSSVVDAELSDSLSTGEIPPDVTFR